jgi:glycosyltransferase involved in cell wall biosynthesis
MVCAHEPTLDPRIRWSAESAAHKFDVVVLGFHRQNTPRPNFEKIDGYTIARVDRVNQKAQSYFHDLKSALPRSFRWLAGLAAAALPSMLLCERLLRLVVRSGRRARQSLTPPNRSVPTYSPEPADAVPSAPQRKLDAGLCSPTRRLHRLRDRFHYVVDHLAMQFSPAVHAFGTFIEQMHRKPDVIHCNDLDTLLVGVLAKKRFGSRLIYDAHEYYPFCDPQGSWLDQKCFSVIEAVLIRHCDEVVTVNPRLAAAMARDYGLTKVYSVPNAEPWVEKRITARASRMASLAGERRKFLFQGRFTHGRGIEEMVRAWAHVDGSRAALFLRGPDSPWREHAINLARELGLLEKCVHFLDPVAEELLVAAAAEADVGLIPYLPLALNDRLSCPNKLSQYMHAGLMVVANDLPYVRSVVEESGAGLIYSSDSPQSFIDVINLIARDATLLRTSRDNAKRFARERFHWAAFAPTFEALYSGEAHTLAETVATENSPWILRAPARASA